MTGRLLLQGAFALMTATAGCYAFASLALMRKRAALGWLRSGFGIGVLALGLYVAGVVAQ